MAKILFIAGNTRSLIANRGDLVRRMQSDGHDVCALVPEHDVLPEIEQLGIYWHTVKLRRSGINPVKDAASLMELIRLIREIAPDKVFAYTIKPIVYGIPAARWANVESVYAMVTGLGYVFSGESVKQRLLRSVVRRLYRFSLRKADVVFFQNPDDRAQFENMKIVTGSSRSALVNGSGVDTNRFSEVPVPGGPLVFLLIARLLEDKGIREFVRAAQILKEKYPDVVFNILGPHDSSLPHSLSDAEISHLQNDPAVNLLGHKKDVRSFIAKSHVCVLPSYREGTPRSILEAMSMGRPVVTSDAPGCRETVEEGVNGFLVPPRSVEPLARAMERFILDPQLLAPMGMSGRRIAEEKYDVHKVNSQIMQAMGLA